MGREEPGDSHPIISEWGGGWVGLSQVRAVSEPEKCNIFLSPKLSLILVCLIFLLRDKILKKSF
jgi:hypothetical protein